MRQQYHARVVGTETLVWDVRRLVDLARRFPASTVPLGEICELDENWWYTDPAHLPTPRSIAAHMELVAKTDLAHPVLLCAEGRLMDGMHRAVKALLEGRAGILAVRFPKTPAPDFVNVSLDDLPYDDD